MKKTYEKPDIIEIKLNVGNSFAASGSCQGQLYVNASDPGYCGPETIINGYAVGCWNTPSANG